MVGVLRRGAVEHFIEHALGRLDHHVGIDDIGVGFRRINLIVFVGTDLVVLAGVGAQIQEGIAADAAHAGLEVARFVLVRHDAQAAVFGKGFQAVKGLIALLLRHQQGLEAKVALEGIVLFKDTHA